MKKRIISLLLSAAISAMALFQSIPAYAAAEYTHGDFTYQINGSEVTITKYNGTDSEVYIPDIIDGRKVTCIGDHSFSFATISSYYAGTPNYEYEENNTLHSVRLPAFLSRIESGAFAYCTQMESIVVPNSVKYIDSGAFVCCKKLSEVVFGENVTEMKGGAFRSTSIERISLSDSLGSNSYAVEYNYNYAWFGAIEGLSDVYIRNPDAGFGYVDASCISKPYVHYTHQESYEKYNKWVSEGRADFVPLAESHSKVSFNTNGGDTPNSELWTLNGQMVSEEIPPEKKDCEFIGWYTNPEGSGKAWDFTTDRVYSDITLYAKWRPAQYTITFDSQGGSCTTTKTDYSFGLAVGELPIPTKTDYQFIGWYTRPDANGEKYETTTIMPRSDITLYAGWLQKGKSLIINYNANGGECSKEKSLVGYGETILDMPVPSKEGNRFLGWNTSSDGNGKFYTTSTKVEQPYITLYAIWKPDTYTISFKPNGGAVDSLTKQVDYDTRIGNLPTAERDGYEFMGWYYSDGTKAYNSDTMPAENITLTAHWSGFEYMILFDARGGTFTDDTKFVSCGESVGELPVPVRKGYKFLGWYTKTKCKGKLYNESTEMPEKDITLYAGWKKVTEYASTVKLNKSKLTLGVGQNYALSVTTIPDVTIDSFKWKSSNPKVATVSSKGVITAKGVGTTTVTVTTTKGKTASVKVTVKKGVTSIKTPYSSRTIKVGQTIKITPTLSGYAGTLTWSSSNQSVASVDSKGNVKGLKKGTTTITVKAYNGVSTKVIITVK